MRLVIDAAQGQPSLTILDNFIIKAKVYVCKDGTVCWLKSTLVPQYNHDEMLVSYDGLLKDITERRELQENLDRKQRNI